MAKLPTTLFAYTEDQQPAGVYVGYFCMQQLEDGSIRVTIRERGDGAAPHASLLIPADRVTGVFR